MDRFDPLRQEWLEHPAEQYAALRSGDPVHWSERLQAWVLTRYADCREVIERGDAFGKDFRLVGDDIADADLTVQMIDGDDHTRLRAGLLDELRVLRPDLLTAARACTLMSAQLELLGGEFDVVEAVARPFALALIAEIVGVPASARPIVRDVSRAVVAGMDAGLDRARAEPAREASHVLAAVVRDAVASPQRTAGLAASVERLAATGSPRPLVINSIKAMLHAGYESLSRFLGLSVLELTSQPPDLVAALDFAEPGVLGELGRLCGPVQADSRVCVTESTLASGARFRTGDVLVVALAAANRDPVVFPDPDRFDPARRGPRDLVFGSGPHACLGRAVARAAIPAALETLLQDPARILEITGPAAVETTATLRGLATLPARFRVRDQP